MNKTSPKSQTFNPYGSSCRSMFEPIRHAALKTAAEGKTLIWCALTIAWLLTLAGSQGLAQEENRPPETNATPTETDDPVEIVEEPEQTFQQLVDEINANEDTINRLFATIPLGFPAMQKEHMNRIAELRTKNEGLQQLKRSTALREFQRDPHGSIAAGKMVFDMIVENLDPQQSENHFNPQGALEYANLMLQSNLSQPALNRDPQSATNSPDEKPIPNELRFSNVAYQAFRASYALQDFERADLMLTKIANSGVSLPPETRQRLAQSQGKWDRELKFRMAEAEADDLPRVKFTTTEGDIVIELFENEAPETVNNFISLVEKNFYDDLIFFQVRPGQFSQTGCKLGNGKGDAGYHIASELDREQTRDHFTGTVSMVTEGPNSGSSQFRILHQPNANFDGRYTAFGRVIEGLDVVFQLNTTDKTKLFDDELEPSKIIKTSVIRKRDHEYAPTRVAKANDNS